MDEIHGSRNIREKSFMTISQLAFRSSSHEKEIERLRLSFGIMRSAITDPGFPLFTWCDREFIYVRTISIWVRSVEGIGSTLIDPPVDSRSSLPPLAHACTPSAALPYSPALFHKHSLFRGQSLPSTAI
jgi:hypothetical protein